MLVLLIDKNSPLLDAAGQNLSGLIHEYALANATVAAIYIGEKANRAISGQPASSIKALPEFCDSDGRSDTAVAIQSWVYEAQANMYSGSAAKLRTAIFSDVCDALVEAHRIEPAEMLGRLGETEYFQADCGASTYEPMKITRVSRLEALAKNGDEKAMHELGLAYAAGEGVEKNEPKAQMLLYRSYLRGNVDAIFALVDLFDEPSEHFRNEAKKHR